MWIAPLLVTESQRSLCRCMKFRKAGQSRHERPVLFRIGGGDSFGGGQTGQIDHASWAWRHGRDGAARNTPERERRKESGGKMARAAGSDPGRRKAEYCRKAAAWTAADCGMSGGAARQSNRDRQ